MPSLKAIRKRIASVKSTQKITKAMKMVAAAKLRRAQDAVQAMRPYARRMRKVSEDLAERVSTDLLDRAAGGEEEALPVDAQHLLTLLQGGAEERVRLVAVTSDRGLAGAFNSNVCRRAERFVVEKAGAQVQVDILGKKGRDNLRRRKVRIANELPGADPKTAEARARELSALLTRAVLDGQVDAVYVVYNEFKTVATQAVRVERLLPLRREPPPPPAGTPEAEARTDEPRTLIDFLYEPGKLEVLGHLVPLYIETELTRILLESIASEFGARMSAMDNASRNAKEMISRLTLQYNRARQASITKELMEIVGGAEALKG
jgi:F-type H+-transporting ATPase subunit gamma